MNWNSPHNDRTFVLLKAILCGTQEVQIWVSMVLWPFYLIKTRDLEILSGASRSGPWGVDIIQGLYSTCLERRTPTLQLPGSFPSYVRQNFWLRPCFIQQQSGRHFENALFLHFLDHAHEIFCKGIITLMIYTTIFPHGSFYQSNVTINFRNVRQTG